MVSKCFQGVLNENVGQKCVNVLRSTKFADQKIPKNVAIFYNPPSLNINAYTFFESVALR